MFYKEKGKCSYNLQKNNYSHLRRYLDQLVERMRKKGLCKRLQHSGSTTEGLKVNDKIEFDVMIIARGENLKITNVEGHRGYVHLTIKEESKGYKKNTLQRYIDNSTYLSPSIFTQKNIQENKSHTGGRGP